MAEQDLSLTRESASRGPSLLDELGALRERRAAETTTDLPLPGYNGRLWATYRLPDAAKAMRLAALMGTGGQATLPVAMGIVAETTRGLYLADEGAEAPVRDEDGRLRPGFQHVPPGTDDAPLNYLDARLERVPQLCPPRPGGREHTAETRVRALFGRDPLVIAAGMSVCGWALGGGDEGDTGALGALSEQFRNGDQPTA